MLADQTDYVIGVDTHRDRHSAAILATSGGLVDQTSARADRGGYATLLKWACQQGCRSAGVGGGGVWILRRRPRCLP
jgi:transposase